MTYNWTFLDDDPFLESADNNRAAQEPTWAIILLRFWELTKFLISLTSAASALLLIYTLTKFASLKNKNHVHLKQFAICVIITAFTEPLFDLISGWISLSGIESGSTEKCLFYQANTATMLVKLCSLLFMTLTWYVEIFQISSRKHIEMARKYSVIFVYILAGVKLCYLIGECVEGYYHHLINSINVILYPIVLVIMMFLNVSLYCKGCKDGLTVEQVETKYILIVGTWVILAWLPSFIQAGYIALCLWLYNQYSFSIWLLVAFVLDGILLYGDGIIVVCSLAYCNEHFKTAFHRIWQRSVKKCSQEDLCLEDGNNMKTVV